MATAWQRPICNAVAAGIRSTPVVARIRMDALDQEDGKAAQDQRGHHHPGAEQHGLDEAVGKRSDHHRRDEAEENVAREADLVRVAQQSARDAKEAMAIGPADGEDRAELDHDLEHLAGRPAKADQVDHEDQMAGRGDRDELGQTLDDPEEKRPEQEFQIHCASLLAAGFGGSRGPQPGRHQLLRADRSPRVNPLASIGGQAERSLPWRQSVTESFRIELDADGRKTILYVRHARKIARKRLLQIAAGKI